MCADASADLMTRLAGLPKFGTGVGLHRMAGLCRSVVDDAWLAGLDAVKVTGSNGKGSVCAMLAAIFEHLPLGYGLYTSPHFLHFRERIVVDGDPISDEDLGAAWHCVERSTQAYHDRHPDDSFGAFEIFTALALRHFSRRRPELVIAEAGIGGRYDSTRVIPGNLTALTSLDLEHTALLGDELELIAYDKADLCPDGGTLVVGAGLDPEVLRRLRGYARTRNVELISVVDVCRWSSCRYEGLRMVADMELRGRRWHDMEIALVGGHQWSNAALAIVLAELWVERHLPELAGGALAEAVRVGLRKVSLPGRFQRVGCDPDVYVDVGHTPAAARAVVQAVRDVLCGGPVLLVTGVSRDKKADEIVATLLEVAGAVVCTRARHKGSSVAHIEDVVCAVRPDLPRWRAQSVEEAMTLARDEARRLRMSIVVGGGLFLAAEAAEVMSGRDPRGLQFL